MSTLESEFYAAKASSDADRFIKACEACEAAGYVVADGHLSATGAVKDAPPAPTKDEAKAIFSPKKKGAE